VLQSSKNKCERKGHYAKDNGRPIKRKHELKGPDVEVTLNKWFCIVNG
jgi:hypothetical protein